MRIDPPQEPGVTFERDADGVVRARGPHNWIVWWQFDAHAAARAVRVQAEYFRQRGLPLEWKVYAHDRPANLSAALDAAGFAAAEPETLMVLDLAVSAERLDSRSAAVEIRRVDDERSLGDLIAVTSAAFDDDAGEQLRRDLPQRLFVPAPRVAAFVAYVDELPVGAGRLESPSHRSFASIWGGATLPAFRRRGIFSALVAMRARAARHAGYAYLTVDARETSRPILARLGFVALATVTGWDLQRDA